MKAQPNFFPGHFSFDLTFFSVFIIFGGNKVSTWKVN